MGANYYAISNGLCPICGSRVSRNKLHIGKSSHGWVFALHVYPEKGIWTLEDWKVYLVGKLIEDEYGTRYSVTEMVSIICDRLSPCRGEAPFGYKSWPDFHEKNRSQFGPNNLVRSKIDHDHCIGHGEGTWDYIIGDFS